MIKASHCHVVVSMYGADAEFLIMALNSAIDALSETLKQQKGRVFC